MDLCLTDRRRVKILYNPYQGLKQKGIEKERTYPVMVKILYNPYQGLKHVVKSSYTVGRLEKVKILYNPYQGLKPLNIRDNSLRHPVKILYNPYQGLKQIK